MERERAENRHRPFYELQSLGKGNKYLLGGSWPYEMKGKIKVVKLGQPLATPSEVLNFFTLFLLFRVVVSFTPSRMALLL